MLRQSAILESAAIELSFFWLLWVDLFPNAFMPTNYSNSKRETRRRLFSLAVKPVRKAGFLNVPGGSLANVSFLNIPITRKSHVLNMPHFYINKSFVILVCILFVIISLNLYSEDFNIQKDKINTNVILTVKVLISQIHDSPIGEVYPVEYSVKNSSDKKITVFSCDPTGAPYLNFWILKPDGKHVPIYPHGYKGNGALSPRIAPGVTITHTNCIPVNVFDTKEGKLFSIVYIPVKINDKQIFQAAMSDFFPRIAIPSASTSPSTTPVAASPTPTP